MFYLAGVTGLTAGSIFLMWLGEQIDKYGIGNGVSLILTAGIIAQMPTAMHGINQLRGVLQADDAASAWPGLVLLAGVRAGGGRRDPDHGRHAPNPHSAGQAYARAEGLWRRQGITCRCGSTTPASCPSSSPVRC
jgi:hypothetical protein